MKLQSIEYYFELTRDEAITIGAALDAAPVDIAYQPYAFICTYRKPDDTFAAVQYVRGDFEQIICNAVPPSAKLRVILDVAKLGAIRRSLDRYASELTDRIDSADAFQRLDRQIVRVVGIEQALYRVLMGV